MSTIVTLTDSAKEHMTTMLKENSKYAVRLGLKGGGCAGFKYEWSFDDNKSNDDEFVEYEDFTLLLDKASLMYLAGMTMEYRKEIFGSFLELKNPNAKSTCGCGESFGA